MTPPFPSELSPAAARRQAVALLVLFYAVIYGMPFLAGATHHRVAAPILSALVIGTLMLLAVLRFVQRDASWRESLGLEPFRFKSVLAWSLLGFLGTYAVNIVLTSVYVAARGDLEAVAARRAGWLGMLADLPVELIFPLAAFAGFWEEIVFRGFLLGRLRAAMPKRETRDARLARDALAVVLTAVLFGGGHGYQGLLGLGQTTVAGLVLGTLVVWRQSIWPAIGAHLAIDALGLLLLQALKSSLTAAAGLSIVR